MPLAWHRCKEQTVFPRRRSDSDGSVALAAFTAAFRSNRTPNERVERFVFVTSSHIERHAFVATESGTPLDRSTNYKNDATAVPR
jgi:hypothetical protein